MNTIATALLSEFEQEMQNTRKILECVPEDKLNFKPHEKSMAMGRLAGHVAELPGWGAQAIKLDLLDIQGSEKSFVPETRKEILDKFESSIKDARELLEKATDEELHKTWTLKFQGKTLFAMPKVTVFRNMVMNHIIHHRAQLGVYLRLNDIALPGMYGPSADEMKFWQPPAKA